MNLFSCSSVKGSDRSQDSAQVWLFLNRQPEMSIIAVFTDLLAAEPLTLSFLQPDETRLKHSFASSPFFHCPFLGRCAVSFLTKDWALAHPHARGFLQESNRMPQLVGGRTSKQGSCTSSPAWLPPLSSFLVWPLQELSLPAHATQLSWHVSALENWLWQWSEISHSKILLKFYTLVVCYLSGRRNQGDHSGCKAAANWN